VDLRDRTDRRHLYEILLTLGTPEELVRWVDGALLVDIWGELAIPRPVRRSWEPVVQAVAHGPTERPWV
jgi:hypothetical protein